MIEGSIDAMVAHSRGAKVKGNQCGDNSFSEIINIYTSALQEHHCPF